MAVTPERIVAGRYALERPLSRGGMGVVWLARDQLLGRGVAVKEIRLPAAVPEPEREAMHARVLREARAAARLNHPGVITLYDVLNEQGHAFLVMELITAPTLEAIVAERGPLPPERVARIGMQVASVLDAAHRSGIVHRDVKPANVMVAEDGGVRLADFGIAQLQGDPELTASGVIVGSPAYMAPEQADGGDCGPETDLWGLGATMYYGVEGSPPFERGNSIATLAAVLREPPRPPLLAGALGPVILSLLAKDPASRPALRQVRIRLARIVGADLEAAAEPTAPTAPVERAMPIEPRPAEPPPAEPTLQVEALPDAADADGGDAAGETAVGGGTAARRRFLALAMLAGVAAVIVVAALAGQPRSGATSGHSSGATQAHTASAPATSRSSGSASAGPRTTTAKGAAPATSPPSQPSPSPGGAVVPAGWTRFANPSGGYTVAYPSGWRRVAGLARHGTAFSEGTGRYLKVESAHPPQVPANGDPVPGWIQNEQYWSARLPGYHLIGSVRAGSYHGMRAAIWEYTYLLNGRPTHGLNISFVSPSRTWGYSVLSLVPADQWGASQSLIRSFEQAFSPQG